MSDNNNSFNTNLNKSCIIKSNTPIYNAEIERDIYIKWLKKCKKENEIKRSMSEKNLFNKILTNRNILYRAKEIPSTDKLKQYYPYLLKENNYNNNSNYYIDSNEKKENKYDLYTLDGFPRHNYAELYTNYINNNKRRSVLTNQSLYDKNNSSFDEYKTKQKEILEFNKHIALDNIKYRDYILNQKKLMNEERIKEINKLKEIEFAKKIYEDEQKRVYKHLLDNQIKVKVPSKLGPIYYEKNFNEKFVNFHQPCLYITWKENSFMNRNKLVEINPYSMKKTNLGKSLLGHNPILNPVFDFKYNKYLFPKNGKTNYNNNNKIC